MFNLLISLGAAVVGFLAFFATHVLSAPSAGLVGLIAGAVAYFFLARRSLKQLEQVMGEAQKELMAARQGQSLNKVRIDAGLAKMKEGFRLGRWQFLVNPQVHAQLGMLYFMLERYDEARPYLEKSFVRIGLARAMLAILHYQAKQYDQMTKVFEEAVRADKKNGLLWSTYAWCLEKIGQRDKAVEALARAVKENPADEKLKENQKALQNGERLRMKPYGQEWWSMRLESPPMDFVPAGMRQPTAGFRKGYRQPPKAR